MHSILLIVEMPPMVEKQEERNVYVEGHYGDAVNLLRELSYTNKTLELLGDNVVLFRQGDVLGLFSEVRGNLSHVCYRYLIFDKEPEWHEVPRKISLP